jgi:hypothetical protein
MCEPNAPENSVDRRPRPSSIAGSGPLFGGSHQPSCHRIPSTSDVWSVHDQVEHVHLLSVEDVEFPNPVRPSVTSRLWVPKISSVQLTPRADTHE